MKRETGILKYLFLYISKVTGIGDGAHSCIKGCQGFFERVTVCL